MPVVAYSVFLQYMHSQLHFNLSSQHFACFTKLAVATKTFVKTEVFDDKKRRRNKFHKSGYGFLVGVRAILKSRVTRKTRCIDGPQLLFELRNVQPLRIFEINLFSITFFRAGKTRVDEISEVSSRSCSLP